jgi:hypothetical protein
LSGRTLQRTSGPAWASWIPAALVLALLMGVDAQAANTGALAPTDSSIPLDELAALSVEIDFDDATLGGGLVITPGPGLLFESFSFDAGFPDIPALRLVCPDAGEPACDDFAGPGVLIAFGQLSGLSGSHTVGSLVLQGATPGAIPVAMAEDEPGGVAGPFVPTIGGTFEAPTFSGAEVEVVSLVPALGAGAALTLAGSILTLGLGSLKRRDR